MSEFSLATTNPFEGNKAEVIKNEMDFAGEVVGGGKKCYSSFSVETMEDKKKIYNITNNPDKSLKDCIGETIELKDIYVESVECIGEDGEVNVCPRSILIDTNNVSYGCVSTGIFHALKRIISIFGEPTYPEGLKVKVKQISKKANRSVLTLLIE